MREIRLDPGPLLLVIAVGLGLWILLQVLAQALWVLVLILVAAVLAAAMMPIVRFVRRARLPPRGWRIPKAAAVLLIYAFGIGVLSLVISVAGTLIVDDVVRFAEAFPELAADLGRQFMELEDTLGLPTGVVPTPQELATRAEAAATALLDAIGQVFAALVEFIFHLFIVLTLALFLVVESQRVFAFWLSLFRPHHRRKVRMLTATIANKMGLWVLGQLTVAVIVGVLAGVGTAIIGLPYPALFGLMTGLIELAPVLGPTLMAFPAFLVGLTQSPLIAVAAALFFFALAQLDGNVLSPLITGRAVQISPTLIIIAVPFGLALYGPLGALLAIPVTAALQVLTREVLLPLLVGEPVQASKDDANDNDGESQPEAEADQAGQSEPAGEGEEAEDEEPSRL